MKVLLVITSHDTLGNSGKKSGYWLEEVAAPYYRFRDAGAELVLASPKGGEPPLDPRSAEESYQTADTRRFVQDAAAQAQLAATQRLATVRPQDFDAVFYPGGHGPLWDLAEDRHSIQLIEDCLAAGTPVALVCHAPGALRHVKQPDGSPLVRGRHITGFSNAEEVSVDESLPKLIPFSLEDVLKAEGAHYSKAENWAPYVVTDGLLLTGQNPASAGPAAKELMALVRQLSAAAPVAQAGE